MNSSLRTKTYSIALFLSLLATSCTETKRDWQAEFQADAKKTLLEIKTLSEPLEREHIALSLLNSYPESASELCGIVQSKVGKQTCNRFKMRPHLWTIEEEDYAFWNGGKLSERLVFPRGFQVRLKDVQLEVSKDCEANQLCLRTKAEEFLYKDWETSAQYCLAIAEKRGQYDCLFHLSEQLPVHIDNYLPAVSLCALAKPYAGECHNHLLLRFSSSFWTKLEWHQMLIEKFGEVYEEANYVLELKDAYWSIVGFRVIGMMMPLQVTEFLDWPAEFQPYLRSAIALRIWDDEDPVLLAKRTLNREPQRVSKARGPGAPRFRARGLWRTQNANLRWIRFCALRGGVRPVHSDPEIDLVWAILTASAMADPVRLDSWNNIDLSRWEVRWAMAHLLKELNQKKHPLYQILAKDEDRRVRMEIK